MEKDDEIATRIFLRKQAHLSKLLFFVEKIFD